MKQAYKTIFSLIFVSVALVAFGYFIWTQSTDGILITNGFKLEQSGTTVDYLQWVKGYSFVNLTDINMLQEYAHNFGVKTIYSNMHHVTDYAGVLSYYFFSSNQTLYFVQYQVIEDHPYPIMTLVPGLLLIAVGIIVVITVVGYLEYRKEVATNGVHST